MIEIYGNLWNVEADARCITTNGFVKYSGECVMGRGCAKQAANKFKELPLLLGKKIKHNGNHVYDFAEFLSEPIITFPTKHVWWEKSDITLIRNSCFELMKISGKYDKIILPRPGCSNGGLRWEFVKENIKDILSDKIYVITYN